MPIIDRELGERLLEALRERQWSMRNAAENYYCPACCSKADRYKDQQEHRDSCSYMKLIEDLKKALK